MDTIDLDQLQQYLRKGREVVFLDVRPTAEFDTEHIPGTVNCPFRPDDFVSRVRGLVPSTETVVIIHSTADTEEWRAAAGLLRAAGYLNVLGFRDGVAGWKHAGGQTIGAAMAPPRGPPQPPGVDAS